MPDQLKNGLTSKLGQSHMRRLGGEPLLTQLKAKYKRSPSIRRGSLIAKNASKGNGVVAVGEHPQGFGKTFIWDRQDAEILLVMFINAADDMGVSVLGLQPNDLIQVTSAAGIASFSEDKGNPLASSITSLIAVGAKAALGLTGLPEIVPIVDAAEKFAQEQFKATNAKTKRRNAFGVDPSSGHKARQEGGLVISLPEAGEPYYSGNDDHKERWIKTDGTRTDNHRPKHVALGFFPIPGNSGHNTRFVFGNNAPLYVLAWDHIFEDNAGFYKVFLHIKRGTPPPDPPVIL